MHTTRPITFPESQETFSLEYLREGGGEGGSVGRVLEAFRGNERVDLEEHCETREGGCRRLREERKGGVRKGRVKEGIGD